jgi:hypothetical protein
MPAGRGGKLKTVAQSAAIMIYIVPLPDPVQPVAKVAMAVALVLTVATGLDYMFQAYRMREGSERTRLKRAARRAARCASPVTAAPSTPGTVVPGTMVPKTAAPGPLVPENVAPGTLVPGAAPGSPGPARGAEPGSGTADGGDGVR